MYKTHSCMHAKSLQLCLILCDPMDCSPPGSSVHGILQARILKWVPCPPSGDLLDLGIEPVSLTSLALAGEFIALAPSGSPIYNTYVYTMYNLVHMHTHSTQCTHISHILGYIRT